MKIVKNKVQPIPSMKKIPPKSKPPVFKPQDYSLSGVSISQIQQFKQVFDLFDQEKIGKIDPKQLKNILITLGIQTKNKTFYQAIISLQKQGPIDFNKFLQIISARTGLKKNKQNISKLFKLYDYQRSGFISQKNLKQIAKDIGLKISQSQLNLMIQRTDKDNDGLISQEQFYQILNSKN